MNNKQYIIFDLDGTLVDSRATVAGACKRVFAKFAPDATPDDNYFLSFRLTDMERQFSEMAGMAGMSVADFRINYDEQYVLDCVSGTKPIKQQYDILRKAKGLGVGIIILTNKLQSVAEQVCNTFFKKDEIDIIIGREDANPIKPRQILIDKLCAYGVIPSKQCLMYYGDSESDRMSADLLCVPYIEV